jgi:aminoglycoside phosphotransferase (APT) family kinase protein
MFTPTDYQRLTQVVQRIDPTSQLLRAWELEGGVSAQVIAFEVASVDGQPRKRILRIHSEEDRRDNPNIAADEFRLLQALQTVDLPTATPHLLDESGSIFSVPYVVIDYLAGEIELAPADPIAFAEQVAVILARLHRAELTRQEIPFIADTITRYGAWLQDRSIEVDHMVGMADVRSALIAHWPLPQPNAPRLLHGDFWPGNLLWQGGTFNGLIDWEDAVYGDPLVDFAHSRLEMLWALGDDAQAAFSAHYRTQMPQLDYSALPYWDLFAAWRPAPYFAGWGGDAEQVKRMRAQHRQFIAQAMAHING